MCYPSCEKGGIMVTVRIYRLDHPPGALADRLLEARIEAARVWT